MAGGGRGGPVVFPHPDDDDAGRLLDNVGSTNANEGDNDDTPLPPPKNNGDAPRGEGGRDDDGAGRRRDGGGGEQGRGCKRDERDERDERDRSSGSAQSACGGGDGDMVVVLCIEQILLYCMHLPSEISADICADIWSRQQISLPIEDILHRNQY